ncbi:hypothetical protein ATSB10_09680 [Dyella thiooxydans]|uniref:Uncharacterized protein n=1 Tax=Dyella thiooxydans TaxID=445710 RepID=A0A160N053_9GAMM|nr:hypothetical protein [Dyella thiooxydans]AND68422.1 hypothetical protein ATSB10_09680 [Dyella thiooxydans]
MNSPAYYSLHPVAYFFDCGIGSDPTSTGPCTGTYTAAQVGQGTASIFSSGKAQVIAVGAVLLALAAILVLIRLSAAATSGRNRKGKQAEAEPLNCERCGAAINTDDEFPTSHGDLCGDCFFAAGEGALTLLPGQAMCMSCGVVVDMAEGEHWDGCPACGFNGSEEEEAMGVCSVCGVESAELVGDLFPACPDCAAESEERAIREDTDDGPSDADTYDGNPDGIGGGGVRA